MFYDAALEYDPASRRCDTVLTQDGDLKIDTTPITPLLMSIGLDRRAAPDDELPVGRTKFLAPSSFSERRGSPCDGLDPKGQLSGVKCWLLDRAKETEATKLLYKFWLSEGLQWVEDETGTPVELDVEWLRPGFLGYRILVDETALSIAVPVGEPN